MNIIAKTQQMVQVFFAITQQCSEILLNTNNNVLAFEVLRYSWSFA